MKNYCFCFMAVCCAISGRAQSAAGLIGIRDTSYTTYSAYAGTVKTHPQISVVPDSGIASVSRHLNIGYATAGRVLYLDAFSPVQQSITGRPAVIILHGGGWRSGNRMQHHPLAEALAARGLVCFTPEYRLSTEALYPAAVLDVKAAVRWVRANASRYHVNPGKIAVLGFSAGGELAAFTGATNLDPRFEGTGGNARVSSAVQAVVDLDGTLSFVHPESGEGDDSRSTSAATYWFGYPKKDNPALWQDASPLAHAGRHTPPTLFVNSGVDRMHAGRDDFRKVLDSLHIYTEVHQFPGAPHSFPLFRPWFDPLVDYITAFLKKVFG